MTGARYLNLCITYELRLSLCEVVMVKLTRIGGFDENSLIELWRPAIPPAPKLAGQSRVHFVVQRAVKTRSSLTTLKRS